MTTTQQTAALVAANPGRKTVELAELCGVTVRCMKHRLDHARRAGLICTSAGNSSQKAWHAGATPPASKFSAAEDAAMLLAATPAGVRVCDVDGVSHAYAYRFLCDQVAAGVLFGNDHKPRRFFTSEFLLNAWDKAVEKRNREKATATKRRQRAANARSDGGRAWGNQTIIPRSLKSEKPAPAPAVEIVIPADVKRTRCPAPAFDSRYQIDPSERVLGGFATLGVGRYLEAEAA